MPKLLPAAPNASIEAENCNADFGRTQEEQVCLHSTTRAKRNEGCTHVLFFHTIPVCLSAIFRSMFFILIWQVIWVSGMMLQRCHLPKNKNLSKLFHYISIVSHFPSYIDIFLPGHRLSGEPVLVFHFLVHPQDRPWTALFSSFCLVWRVLASPPHGMSHRLLFCLR